MGFFLDFGGFGIFCSSKIQAVKNRSLATHQLLNGCAHDHTITDQGNVPIPPRKYEGDISNQVFVTVL